MRIILVLLSTFFINNFANASDFEITVYFNLENAEKRGLVKCSQGRENEIMASEYHLAIYKNKPSYTILGNLNLDKDLIDDIKSKLHCNKGDFFLKKTINSTHNFIDLYVYLVETFIIKDSIFDVANIRLSSDEDYLMKRKYINESGQIFVTIISAEEVVSTKGNNTTGDDSELIYSIEIKRN